MSEIIKDSLSYPFSDWKKILILGFIILISNLYVDMFFKSVAGLLFLISFLISFFVLGYGFRIIKSSLNNIDELPKYNDWRGMFKDGVRVYIVHLVYLIPVLLLLLFVFSPSFFYAIIDPSSLNMLVGYLFELIIALVSGSINIFVGKAGILFLATILYLLITIPIQFIGIANMANNNSNLSSAFRFREIFNKIKIIGLKNLLIWYPAIIIPFLILDIFPNPHRIINMILVGYLLIILIVSPYLSMYIYRLVALFYNSK